MIKRIKAHIHYWNKWRKKFPTAYSKMYKFLVLIGLKKPYTLRLLIFADKYNAAIVALNNVAEILKHREDDGEKKDTEKKEAMSDEVSEV